MLSDYKPADDPLEITVSVVEKGLTVALERRILRLHHSGYRDLQFIRHREDIYYCF